MKKYLTIDPENCEGVIIRRDGKDYVGYLYDYRMTVAAYSIDLAVQRMKQAMEKMQGWKIEIDLDEEEEEKCK